MGTSGTKQWIWSCKAAPEANWISATFASTSQPPSLGMPRVSIQHPTMLEYCTRSFYSWRLAQVQNFLFSYEKRQSPSNELGAAKQARKDSSLRPSDSRPASWRESAFQQPSLRNLRPPGQTPSILICSKNGPFLHRGVSSLLYNINKETEINPK